jgi:hypothetical protein
MRKNDKEILAILLDKHIDQEKFGMSYALSILDCLEADHSQITRINSFRAMREKMGLFRTRKQGHNLESIRDAMVALRERFPKAGAQEMTHLLFFENNLSVSR